MEPIGKYYIATSIVITILPLSKFQETVYNEKIKLWIKEEKEQNQQ